MLGSRFAALLGLLFMASFGGRSIAGADAADVVNTQVQRKIDVSTQFAKVCNHRRLFSQVIPQVNVFLR